MLIKMHTKPIIYIIKNESVNEKQVYLISS